MSDTTDQIEALLRGIEERTKHTLTCGGKVGRYDAEGMYIDHVCDCDRPARVRAEQARTVERIGDTIIDFLEFGERQPYVSGGSEFEQAWAAALRAGEEHQ